jgi:hypothetical protein
MSDNENIKTNFLIVPKPTNTDIIGTEVTRQYIRLGIFFILIFLVVILVLKEYLDGLRFMQDLSIFDVLLESDEML